MLIIGDGPINRDVGKLPESQASDFRVGEDGQVVHLHQKTCSLGALFHVITKPTADKSVCREKLRFHSVTGHICSQNIYFIRVIPATWNSILSYLILSYLIISFLVYSDICLVFSQFYLTSDTDIRAHDLELTVDLEDPGRWSNLETRT